MSRKLIGRFYITEAGASPVEKWLNEQTVPVQAKIAHCMSLLEDHWEMRPFLFVQYLRDGLFEIKNKVNGTWPRVIYFHYHDDQLIYLHGFLKKGKKIPPNELEIAMRRRRDFYRREEKNETEKGLPE